MWRCHQLRLLAHLAPFNFPGRGPTRHRGRVAHGRRPRTARIVSRVGASGCLWVAFGIAAAANSRAGAFWLWVALGCSFGGAPSRLALAKVTARGAPARSQSRLFDGFVSVPGTTVAAAARPRRAHALHARRPGGAHLVVRRGVGDHPERSAVDAGQAI